MKKQTTKQFYTNLLKNKYGNTSLFFKEIQKVNNIFWESCREFSKEILQLSTQWKWLSYRVDDFANIVEADMIEKMEKWSKKGSLSKQTNSIEDTISWLFDRHVNCLKNLFDTRYRNSLDLSTLVNLEDFEPIIMDYSLENQKELDSFFNLNKKKKIEIFTKLWIENQYDSDFDIGDLQYLCTKYGAPPPKTFLNLNFEQNYELKQTESGNSQLVFIFE